MHIYPAISQYPVDVICRQIFEEMEKRNWSVPGINCKFDHGEVDTIHGDDFRLWFARRANGYQQHAVMELIIPCKELTVYGDFSGPTLVVYVGQNWNDDKNWFLCSGKVNSKLYGKPRRYLQYRKVGGRLEHHTDLGREYGLEDGDQPYYLTSEVYQEFCEWLKVNVLDYIRAQK